MEDLKNSVKKFVNLAGKAKDLTYYAVVSQVFDVFNNINLLEKKGVGREVIQQAVSDCIPVIQLSPFFNRIHHWPRGYPGDFETIQYILDAVNKSENNTIHYYMESYALTSPAAQQHRNKIQTQANKILEVYRSRNKEKIRVLSIGCGACIDILSISHQIDANNVEFVLLDSDEDAIIRSKFNLAKYNDTSTFINGNIFKNLIKLKDVGKFDLIIAGGLFDYLNDAMVIKIISSLREHNLFDEGIFFFTNLSGYNPDRILMEYLANWNLIYRDKSDLLRIVVSAGFAMEQININKDLTNISYLVSLKN